MSMEFSDYGEDLFQTANLRNLNELDDDFKYPYGRIMAEYGLKEDTPVFEVEDIITLIASYDYEIPYARTWITYL